MEYKIDNVKLEQCEEGSTSLTIPLERCSIGAALSVSCSSQGLPFRLDGSYTDREKMLIRLRSGVYTVYTVCDIHHEQFVVNYAATQRTCCNPLGNHRIKTSRNTAKASIKTCYTISESFHDTFHDQLPRIIEGRKLCRFCVAAIKPDELIKSIFSMKDRVSILDKIAAGTSIAAIVEEFNTRESVIQEMINREKEIRALMQERLEVRNRPTRKSAVERQLEFSDSDDDSQSTAMSEEHGTDNDQTMECYENSTLLEIPTNECPISNQPCTDTDKIMECYENRTMLEIPSKECSISTEPCTDTDKIMECYENSTLLEISSKECPISNEPCTETDKIMDCVENNTLFKISTTKCSIGDALSQICSPQEVLFRQIGSYTEREKMLIKVRSGVDFVCTVCDAHHKRFITSYSNSQLNCCNPLGDHKPIRGNLSSTRRIRPSYTITAAFHDTFHEQLPRIIEGRKLCQFCLAKINPEEPYRKCFSIKDSLLILDSLAAGTPIATLAQQFRTFESVIQDIVNREKLIRQEKRVREPLGKREKSKRQSARNGEITRLNKCGYKFSQRRIHTVTSFERMDPVMRLQFARETDRHLESLAAAEAFFSAEDKVQSRAKIIETLLQNSQVYAQQFRRDCYPVETPQIQTAIRSDGMESIKGTGAKKRPLNYNRRKREARKKRQCVQKQRRRPTQRRKYRRKVAVQSSNEDQFCAMQFVKTEMDLEDSTGDNEESMERRNVQDQIVISEHSRKSTTKGFEITYSIQRLSETQKSSAAVAISNIEKRTDGVEEPLNADREERDETALLGIK